MRFGSLLPHRRDELDPRQANHEPQRCIGCKPQTQEAQPRPFKLQPGVVDGPYKQNSKGVMNWLKGLLS